MVDGLLAAAHLDLARCRHISAHCRRGCGSRGAAGSAARRSRCGPSAANATVASELAIFLGDRRGERRHIGASRTVSRDRPTRASVRMSSSVAVISSIVAIIRSRSSSGSTDSARMRSEASGVRRSWPIAPSVRSFSSSRSTTRAFIALKARIALRRSAGPRGSTDDRLVAAAESLRRRGEVAQRPRERMRDQHRRGEHEQIDEQGRRPTARA